MVRDDQRDSQQSSIEDHREDHHSGSADVDDVGPAGHKAREHAQADSQREQQRRRVVQGQPDFFFLGSRGWG